MIIPKKILFSQILFGGKAEVWVRGNNITLIHNPEY